MKKLILWVIFSFSIFAKKEIRIAFFPNITHGQALVGKNQKIFDKYLVGTNITWKMFNGGPSAIEAFMSNQVDIGYVGPGPALNGYIKTKGDLFIIGGAASGGAVLVTRKGSNIKTVKDLSGKKVAIPQIGNTQDIVLRSILKNAGLKPSYKGGTVEIVHSENSYIKTLMSNNDIDAALVPEPWGTRLVQELDAKILLDSKELYANGNYPTTVIVVRKDFYDKNKDLVEKFLKAHIELTNFMNKNKEKSKKIINKELKALTGKSLKDNVINVSYDKVIFTNNPQIEATKYFLDLQIDAGFIRNKPDISGLFNLTILDKLMKKK